MMLNIAYKIQKVDFIKPSFTAEMKRISNR